MIIFQHIPKTGGTSLRSQLEKEYDNKLFYNEHDFPTSSEPDIIAYKKHKYSDDIAKVINGGYDVIFGHFAANKYKFLYDIVPIEANICFLREPAERTISHYCYWKMILEKKYVTEGSLIWRAYPDMIKLSNNELSLVDFAKLDWVRNFYEIFLSDIDDYSFIGFTERYNSSIAKINSMLGINIMKSNENVTENKLKVGSKERSEIKHLNASNYKIYNLALKKF